MKHRSSKVGSRQINVSAGKGAGGLEEHAVWIILFLPRSYRSSDLSDNLNPGFDTNLVIPIPLSISLGLDFDSSSSLVGSILRVTTISKQQ